MSRQQLVEIGRSRHQRLAPAEGEQPASEIGAVLGGMPHRFGELAQAVVLDLRCQNIGVEQDRRQHVVEVVSDAAGQLADGFHALGLRQLGFGMLAIGDVRDDGSDRRDRIGGIQERKFDAQHRPPADRRIHGHLALERRLGCGDLAIRPFHVVRAFLGHHIPDLLADGGRAGGTDPSFGGAVHERVAALEVLDEDEHRRVIHDGLELGLVGAQRRAGLVALGDRPLRERGSMRLSRIRRWQA